MEVLFFLLIAVAPPILIVYYIQKIDKYDKEPTDNLIKAFLFGCLSTVPTYYSEIITYEIQN